MACALRRRTKCADMNLVRSHDGAADGCPGVVGECVGSARDPRAERRFQGSGVAVVGDRPGGDRARAGGVAPGVLPTAAGATLRRCVSAGVVLGADGSRSELRQPAADTPLVDGCNRRSAGDAHPTGPSCFANPIRPQGADRVRPRDPARDRVIHSVKLSRTRLSFSRSMQRAEQREPLRRVVVDNGPARRLVYERFRGGRGTERDPLGRLLVETSYPAVSHGRTVCACTDKAEMVPSSWSSRRDRVYDRGELRCQRCDLGDLVL